MHPDTEKEFDKSFNFAYPFSDSGVEVTRLLKSFISFHFIDKQTLEEEIEKFAEWWRENKDEMDSGYSIGIDVAITHLKQRLGL